MVFQGVVGVFGLWWGDDYFCFFFVVYVVVGGWFDLFLLLFVL